MVIFAPFRVVIFTLIIAYGIATRKIMEVGFFFQRITAYAGTNRLFARVLCAGLVGGFHCVCGRNW